MADLAVKDCHELPVNLLNDHGGTRGPPICLHVQDHTVASMRTCRCLAYPTIGHYRGKKLVPRHFFRLY